MDNKHSNQDTSKNLERYYSTTSSASQNAFDKLDYLAKKGSDVKEYFEEKKQLEEEQKQVKNMKKIKTAHKPV